MAVSRRETEFIHLAVIIRIGLRQTLRDDAAHILELFEDVFLIGEEVLETAVGHTEGAAALRGEMRHVARFVHPEILGEVLGEIAVCRDINAEILERFNCGPQINHLILGTAVSHIHQRVGGQPMGAGADGLDIRLGTEHKQEARRSVGKVKAEHIGRAHITWQYGTIALGVVGRDITHQH